MKYRQLCAGINILIYGLTICPAGVHAQEYVPPLHYPELVQQFYSLKGQTVFWYTGKKEATDLRHIIKSLLDSCHYEGLDRNRYHYDAITNGTDPAAGRTETDMEQIYTDALFAYCKDLHQGYAVPGRVSYDGITEKTAAAVNRSLLYRIASIERKEDLASLLDNIKCSLPACATLRAELRVRIQETDHRKTAQLREALNTYRWIGQFRFDRFILVNVAAAQLDYYVGDSVVRNMKIVAGKPSTTTPRFAAYCDQVIFYPYWHVPRSIAVNEILPMVRKNPAVLDALNLQVINSRGTVMDPGSINWSQVTKANFPYLFRQSTGCDNALGVIKFNLTSPYSVFLHDTNLKSAFASGKRYLSHGCIRLEQPVALAQYLLPGQVDTGYLAACVSNQKPVVHTLDRPVPVFVVYMTADQGSDRRVHYHPDIYRLD